MEKYDLNEGNEALNRVLLMMKYDSKKTLTENKVIVNEQSPSTTKTAESYAKSEDAKLDETLSSPNPPKGWLEISYDEIQRLVSNNEGLADNLDASLLGKGSIFGGSMSIDDMSQVTKTLRSAKNTFFRTQKMGSDEWVCYPMIEGLRAQYGIEESGESLYGEISDPRGSNSAEVQNWSTNTIRLLVSLYKQWLTDIKLKTPTPTPTPTPSPTPSPTPLPKKSKYRVCVGTYTKGCKSPIIAKVQGCLGLVPDGKFGRNTDAALKAKGFDIGFTDNDVKRICNTNVIPPKEVQPPIKLSDEDTLADNQGDASAENGL